VSEAEDRATAGVPSESRTPGDAIAGAWRAPLAAALAWLLPGAGHFVLGKRGRALAFCAIVVACAAIGCLLQGRLDSIQPNDPLSVIATLASLGSGVVHLVLKYVTGYEGSIVAAGYEYGTTFLRTAGILNFLLVLDSLDIARGRKG